MLNEKTNDVVLEKLLPEWQERFEADEQERKDRRLHKRDSVREQMTLDLEKLGYTPDITDDKIIDVAQTVVEYSLDRGGLADCWVDFVGAEKYIWVSSREVWYVWSGTHWVEDRTFDLQNEIQVFMVYLSKIMSDFEMLCMKDAASAKKAADYVKLCKRSPASVLAIEEMAKARLATLPDALDSLNVLNFPNGTLELGNLSKPDFIFRSHQKEDLITYCLPFEYDPNAVCPRFDQFRREVIVKRPPDDDADYSDWQYDEDADKLLFEIISTGLTTSARWQKTAWLQGDGGNGKSVLVETLAYMLGDLAAPFDFDILSKENPGYSLASVQGKRMLFSSESDEGSKFAAKTMKQMVDGSRLNARPIYGKPFDYEGFFTIIWAMNNKPKIISTKNDVWRRLSVHPFYRSFSEEEKDTSLLHTLKNEAPGIMNYILDALKRLINNNHKFTYSQTCEDARIEYKEESNPVAQWMAECTEEPTDLEDWTPASVLFDNFKKWCEVQNRKYYGTLTKFGTTLKDLKVAKMRNKNNIHCELKITKDYHKIGW